MFTTEEAGEVLEIGAPAVAKRCRRGLVPGARRAGRSWLIPDSYLAAALTRSTP